jgi:hypothetical protein
MASFILGRLLLPVVGVFLIMAALRLAADYEVNDSDGKVSAAAFIREAEL